MSLLRIENLSFSLAGRALLDHAALTVDPGRKIGLIGRNGAGKSTLLKLITGIHAPDGGTIKLASRARLGTVAQEAPAGEVTPMAAVLEADLERMALLAETDHAAPERLAEIHDRLIAIDADSAEARAGAILAGLGFDEAAQNRPMASFSGGWRMRVALAAALFAAPDLLLLDEPTNHLDLEATLWLENWLARFPGSVVMVSHDRDLLDRAVDSIAHLDRGKITLTPGGFAEFVRIRTERAEQQNREAARIAAQRAHMQAFVDRFRAKASKARQAQSRLKALGRMPMIDTIVEDAPTRFAFPEPKELAPPLLSLDRVTLGYDGRAVLNDVSLRVDMEDRIALLGANGNGKSTLAKALAGRLAPMSGAAFRTRGITVGYFAQHQEDDLELGDTPLLHLARVLPNATVTQLRAQGARFGLDAARIETKVSKLSGGEKARLLLALATRDAPQVLILDEPTNHLDIDAREALVRALTDFPGAVILVTHDTHLIDLVADRLLLVSGGSVVDYDDELEAYRRLITQKNSAPAQDRKAAPTRDDRKSRAEAREATAPLRRTARDAEKKIKTLDTERKRLEAKLADAAFYARAKPEEIASLNQRLAAIATEIAAAESAWLEAESALEGAN
ncbi:ABC-F family ATP-binding cassette domain-containing protein [Acidiphilium sp. AL]|uniref:ABC-F family ATP-binding cassette domain-containing protein n=1 Tax=Acidiphilium iwatense TaxID=768198 RepID=A0ABS9DYF2_9PROT|nr:MULTISPECIES: ABC-F family ATP-binding cassette domain-containing protein [Acidiphilium]MCF3947709.1 ABC-F family ATP-binding cassette domain-containing protein [Acidiphilium iwatense]MCU4160065.1 ABC-F family ATP-binding cassette domain-containing protein [Acidiphilium sp. AL]